MLAAAGCYTHCAVPPPNRMPPTRRSPRTTGTAGTRLPGSTCTILDPALLHWTIRSDAVDVGALLLLPVVCVGPVAAVSVSIPASGLSCGNWRTACLGSRTGIAVHARRGGGGSSLPPGVPGSVRPGTKIPVGARARRRLTPAVPGGTASPSARRTSRSATPGVADPRGDIPMRLLPSPAPALRPFGLRGPHPHPEAAVPPARSRLRHQRSGRSGRSCWWHCCRWPRGLRSGDSARHPDGASPRCGRTRLGMAGAFSAVSDDATALYYNPAGLARVRATEFSGGVQSRTVENEATYLGERASASLDKSGIHSFSFAYPFPTWRGGLAIALGYHRISDFDFEYFRRGAGASSSARRSRSSKTEDWAPTRQVSRCRSAPPSRWASREHPRGELASRALLPLRRGGGL